MHCGDLRAPSDEGGLEGARSASGLALGEQGRGSGEHGRREGGAAADGDVLQRQGRVGGLHLGRGGAQNLILRLQRLDAGWRLPGRWTWRRAHQREHDRGSASGRPPEQVLRGDCLRGQLKSPPVSVLIKSLTFESPVCRDSAETPRSLTASRVALATTGFAPGSASRAAVHYSSYFSAGRRGGGRRVTTTRAGWDGCTSAGAGCPGAASSSATRCKSAATYMTLL